MSVPPFTSLPDAPAPRVLPLHHYPWAFPPPSLSVSFMSAALPGVPAASVRPPGFPSVLSAPPSAPVFPSLSSAVPPPSAQPPAFSIPSLSAHPSAPGLGSVHGVSAALALFSPFAVSVSSNPPVVSSATPVFAFAAPAVVQSSIPLSFPHASAFSTQFAVSPSLPFPAAPDDAFDPGYPDAVPRDLEAPIPASLPDSYLSEIHRMLSYMIDLFPQAAGSPSVVPPPCALFEDFFGPASIPPQPIHFNWFERVCTALSGADARLASLLASGRWDFSFLPSRSPAYAVRGDFAQGCAAPINPSLSLFERPLRPNHQLG